LGKISEVFVGRGVSRAVKVSSNADNLTLLEDLLLGRSARASFDEGLLMTNLVDFDMLWGHRNDVDGFALGLEAVDAALPRIFAGLRPEDRLVITADHGVDPTTVSTDHSREHVPLLLYPRPEGAPDAVYEGFFADSGATVYETLCGRRAGLAGSSVLRLSPERGWRRYTPVQSTPANPDDAVPVRLGPDEVAEAVEWLRANVGEPPQAAVVLGSGLAPKPAGAPMAEVPYHDIPHWRSGEVEGHPHVLSVVDWMGWRVALLKGRAHEYEGFDESEVQFPVRCLASWGVRHLVLTSASGAVKEGLRAGEVVAADQVVELQAPADASARGVRPVRTSVATYECGLRRVVHASLPGPQYETPAELALLQRMGVGTVSMSPGAELRAAREQGMDVAVLTVVANAGDTTHEEVLQGVARAGEALSRAIGQQLKSWGAPAPLY
ncbi:MAG: hypothetical protein JW990_14800, partial [Thermoleophilia bacterium]|nr:hypothetical protein [Thermoleophilia bacterium]